MTAQLVGEQAALRRVATRIAEGDHPADLFEAVAVEVGQLLEADVTRLLRYEHDRAASIVAGYGAQDEILKGIDIVGVSDGIASGQQGGNGR